MEKTQDTPSVISEASEAKTTWKLYTTTVHAWEEMLSSIRNAEKTIDFEQFNFTPDNIGRQFIDTLIERAKAGAKIRLLVDAMGSVGLGQSVYLEQMEKVGIEVRFFNWIFPFSDGNKSIWYFRNHRRTLIIDGEKALTGGVCISDPMKDWRETTIEITGEVIKDIQSSFDRIWKQVHKKSFRWGERAKTNMDGFSFLTHAPLPRQRYLYREIIDAIRKSQKHVYLTTPYFLPDGRLLRALTHAKIRGVDVRLLVPTNSDHPIVDRGSHTYFHKLLTSGIRIFRYRGMIHAKTLVIDGDWAMVGTINMDNISLKYNFELGVVASNSNFANELGGHFTNDIQNADELTLHEWQERSFISQLLELLVWPIRKFL